MKLGQDEAYISKGALGSELMVEGSAYDNFLDKQ